MNGRLAVHRFGFKSLPSSADESHQPHPQGKQATRFRDRDDIPVELYVVNGNRRLSRGNERAHEYAIDIVEILVRGQREVDPHIGCRPVDPPLGVACLERIVESPR